MQREAGGRERNHGDAAEQEHHIEPEQGRALLREERPRLVRALRALGLTVWEGEANYLLFRAGCTDLRERLLKKDILIRACAGYAGLGPDYYRVCVRTGRENERLLYALKEVL